MATCSTYCLTPLPEFTVNDCNETVSAGGLNAIAFDCSADAYVNSDYTEATILSDIANGNATVFRQVLISSTGATPNAAAATYRAGAEPNVNNYTTTISMMDANVSVANDTAYEDIDATLGRELSAFILTTADGHSELFEAITSFQTTIIKEISDNTDDDIHYAATLTGKMKHKPKMITTPTNIY
jgi:hypothetical protein